MGAARAAATVLSVLVLVGCDLIGANPDPPAVPGPPDGPDQLFPNHAYQFSAVTTDPAGDSIAYQFDWGDGSRWEWTAYGSSGDTGRASHGWSASGAYTVTCRAKNSRVISEWSEGRQVAVVGDGELLWDDPVELGADAIGSPVRMGALMLFVTTGGEVVALDTSGTEHWRVAPGGSLTGTPAVAGDSVVYVPGGDGRVYALGADGGTRWSWFVGYACHSPAVGPDGTVYTGGSDGRLYALEPGGGIGWYYEVPDAVECPAVVTADSVVVFGCDNGAVYAVGPDRVLRWSFQTNGRVRCSPAVGEDGTVYFGSEDNRLYAVDATGGLRWSLETQADVRGSPCIGPDGEVYFGSDDHGLYRVAADGSSVWRYQCGWFVRSGATVTDGGRVYFGSHDDCLYAVDESGMLVWKVDAGGPVGGACLVAEDGTVYFAAGSRVHAVSGTGGPAETAWPMYRHDPQRTGRTEP